MTYIATFFSHFGAIRYKKLCEQVLQKNEVYRRPPHP